MKVVKLVVACVLCGIYSLANAQDALAWLQRMSNAAKGLNYSGVFVYQSGGRSELSRITHVVDATGEHERLETLDGTPREIVRNNDEVQSFLPSDKIVVVDRANKDRFPGSLTTKASTLGDYYNVRLGAVVRVAGREAQTVSLEPRDDMRYGHQFWADMATGLLLKARMINESGQTIEQFAFTEISQGISPERDKLKPHTVTGSDWQVVDTRGNELKPDDMPWVLRTMPIGYRAVSLTRRLMRRDGPDTLHLMLTDGLASMSVFIEPLPKGSNTPLIQGVSGIGATGIFRRIVSDHLVTVLGEVPGAAIRRVAESVELRKKQ